MNKLDKNPYFEFNKEKDMAKLKVQPSAVDAEEAILGSIFTRQYIASNSRSMD